MKFSLAGAKAKAKAKLRKTKPRGALGAAKTKAFASAADIKAEGTVGRKMPLLSFSSSTAPLADAHADAEKAAAAMRKKKQQQAAADAVQRQKLEAKRAFNDRIRAMQAQGPAAKTVEAHAETLQQDAYVCWRFV